MNFFSQTQNLSCTLCTLGWSNFGLLICDKYICSFLKIKIWGEDLHPVLENLLIKSKKSSLIRSRWVAKKKLLPQMLIPKLESRKVLEKTDNFLIKFKICLFLGPIFFTIPASKYGFCLYPSQSIQERKAVCLYYAN